MSICEVCGKERIPSTSLTTGCCMGEVVFSFRECHRENARLKDEVARLIAELAKANGE